MSTRCQTKVIEGQKESINMHNEDITLYHHSNGCPKWMVPLFCRAYRYGITPFVPDWNKDNPKAEPTDAYKWQTFRAGYAASMLCHIDPRGFQPEKSHQLHVDIAWYYKLYISGKKVKGQKQSQWEIEIYKATIRRTGAPSLKKVLKRTPLCDVVDDDGKLKADISAKMI